MDLLRFNNHKGSVVADLSLTFLGMRFRNPVLLASGYPVGQGSGLHLKRFAEFGAGGIIARSVFVDKVEPARNLHPKYVFGEGKSKDLVHLASVYETGSEFFLTQAPQAHVEGVPLIASIIGRSLEDYRILCSMAEECKYIDMIEVNVSCPGTSDFGMHFGDARPNLSQQPDLVTEIIKTVRDVTGKAIIVKVSAMADDIGITAKAAVAGGADAIAAINTMPNALSGIDIETGCPYLPVIGLQGSAGLKPMALGAVVKIRQAVNVPVIGVGGI